MSIDCLCKRETHRKKYLNKNKERNASVCLAHRINVDDDNDPENKQN